jgi:major vault protein
MSSHEYDDMRQGRRQERDLVVAPNEFAYVSDQTKGNINVHVGPLKTTISGTDQLVLFDYRQKKFVTTDISKAIQTFATAPEGWYIVLKNPSIDDTQPASGKAENLKELSVGRKINIPGPISFALWPGQMTKVVKGHILRSNQYLVVRVYDELSAKKNWSNTVIKKAKTDGDDDKKDDNIESVTSVTDDQITIGKLFIIKGTEVSFYIPPTGVEVVAEGDNYIRDALTLERLEYGILKDENGKKRYVKGPDVVFPEPTEVFLTKRGTRKFKAIELSLISGLYIKVIADYEENGVKHKIGDELFITGKDQMIYFPREEHAIMKYGVKDKHYATAIPAGEARYVLNRLEGDIRLEKGPSMFLPDPRKEVLVKRILSIKDVERWFPGNQEAINYNMLLEKAKENDMDGYVEAATLSQQTYSTSRVYEDAESDWTNERTSRERTYADEMQRGTSYTKPRIITIDSKYEGAVVIDVWTGYAVKVKSKTKEPRVIVGPATIMLEYDETLEHMSLSTGTPKSDKKMLDTAYLRVLNNKISDVIYATTKDNCDIALTLSYRVNFEGDLSKAFDVEDYVKFLTDHMRSLGKAVIKGVGVEEFYANPHGIIRDAFLGKKDDDTGERIGRFFDENEMRVYEIEVLAVKIGDKEIEHMLIKNQNETVKQSLFLANIQRDTEFEKAKQEFAREKADAVLQTALNTISNSKQEAEERLVFDLQNMENEKQLTEVSKIIAVLNEEITDIAKDAELERDKKQAAIGYDEMKNVLELKLKHIAAEVQAVQEKGKAITPQLIAALQSLGDKQLTAALSENASLLGMLGGKSVVEVIQNLLGGTKLEKISNLLQKNIEE